MAITIWKAEIPITSRPVIRIPMGAQVLSAGNQREALVCWFLCNPDEPLTPYSFRIFGTGEPNIDFNPKRDRFLGTAIFADGHLVLHIFH